jgi:hypothetical protein
VAYDFNNADDPANFLPIGNEIVDERPARPVFMAGYLPAKFNHSQSLLVAMRTRDIGEYLSHRHACINVGPFSSEEAGDLLRAEVRVLHPADAPRPQWTN